jgi:hypothetical protein
MKKTNLILGLESINFQKLDFYKELSSAFESIRQAPVKDIHTTGGEENQYEKLISGIIKNYTNLTVTLVFSDVMPCVEIPAVSRNNPLVNDWIRSFVDSRKGLELIKNAGNAIRGTVNSETGRVGGIFAEIGTTIYLPVSMLKGSKYTPGELAAITLHEVGHFFTYFEYITHTARTNQALAGIAREYDKTLSIKEREVVLMTARQALNIKDLDVSGLAKVSDKRIVDAVIITNVIEKSKSELGSNLYDDNNFEYLADQFATRMGAGRDLVTGLDKVYKEFGDISTRGLGMYLFWEAVKLIALVIHIGLAVASGPLGEVGVLLNSMLISFLFGRDAQTDATYDRPKIRLERVRNQLMEAQKERGLTKAQQQAYREDVKVIDDILADYNTRFQLVGYIFLYVFRMGKKRFDAEALQRELEQLATNDLFGRAQELKALA